MQSRLLCWFGLLALVAHVGCQEKKGDSQPAPVAAPKDDPVVQPGGGLAGAIKGKAFKPDGVNVEGRRFSFRKGTDFFADMEISFELPAAGDAKLEGREWKFGKDNRGPPVQISAKEGEFPKTDFAFAEDYTLTLKITKHASKLLEGTIDLRVSKPENTHLSGPFSATFTKAASDPLDAEDAPYVAGKVAIMGKWEKESLSAAFVGKGADGKVYSNLAGTNFAPGGNEWVTSTSFKPQITSMFNHAKDGVGFKHVKIAPGEYLVYVRRGGVTADWKKVTVKEGDQQTVDLTIDPAKTGSVVVTLPDEEASDKSESNLILAPVEFDLSDFWIQETFKAAEVKVNQKTVTIKGVPAGKYRALRGKSKGDVEVIAGKETAVTLVRDSAKK